MDEHGRRAIIFHRSSYKGNLEDKRGEGISSLRITSAWMVRHRGALPVFRIVNVHFSLLLKTENSDGKEGNGGKEKINID